MNYKKNLRLNNIWNKHFKKFISNPFLFDMLFRERYIFKDASGAPCGFRWWRRWIVAYWHLRKWLEYEGMPEGIKDIKTVDKYYKRISNYGRKYSMNNTWWAVMHKDTDAIRAILNTRSDARNIQHMCEKVVRCKIIIN